MAKKKKKPKLKFETLKGRAQDIVMRLTNSIALQDQDCCTLDNFAEEFKTTPGRLKTTLLLRRLIDRHGRRQANGTKPRYPYPAILDAQRFLGSSAFRIFEGPASLLTPQRSYAFGATCQRV
jgi:hypothetical protein